MVGGAKNANLVADADRAAADDGHADAAASVEGLEQPGPGVEPLDVGTGGAEAPALEHRCPDPELQADEDIEVDAAGDDVAAEGILRQAEFDEQLGAHEGELLVAPLGVTPVAEPGGVAVPRDAQPRYDFERPAAVHRLAGGRGGEEGADRGWCEVAHWRRV